MNNTNKVSKTDAKEMVREAADYLLTHGIGASNQNVLAQIKAEHGTDVAEQILVIYGFKLPKMTRKLTISDCGRGGEGEIAVEETGKETVFLPYCSRDLDKSGDLSVKFWAEAGYSGKLEINDVENGNSYTVNVRANSKPSKAAQQVMNSRWADEKP